MSAYSANEVRSNIGLPQDLNYELPKSLPSARNQEIVVSPVNGTTWTQGGSVIQIDIPCNRNTYLDTTTSMVRYKMTYTITGTGTSANYGCLLGTSASPFINQSVYANNATLIDQIQEYGALYHAALNSTLTDGEKHGMTTMLQCASGADDLYGSSKNRGHQIGANVFGKGVDNLIFDYAFPLMGVLGGMTTRFFPLHALNTLRLEYTLDQLDMFTSAIGTGVTVTSFTISDFEFIANVITLSDDAQAMVNGLNPEKIYLKSRSFKQSTATLPASAIGNFQLQVGWRASSLVGILMTCYNSDMKEKKFGSICPNLTIPSHYIINGQNFPSRGLNPVDKPSSTYASLQKFWGALSSPHNSGCIDNSSFLVCSATSGLMNTYHDKYNNQFYLAVDTEVVSKRSDSLLAGIDVNSSPIFFNAQIRDALAAYVHTIFFYGYYDVIIEFDLLTKTAVAKF